MPWSLLELQMDIKSRHHFPLTFAFLPSNNLSREGWGLSPVALKISPPFVQAKRACLRDLYSVWLPAGTPCQPKYHSNPCGLV